MLGEKMRGLVKESIKDVLKDVVIVLLLVKYCVSC